MKTYATWRKKFETLCDNRLIALLTVVALLAACGSQAEDEAAPTDELLHLRLPMGYIPDPQYAPFYVAVDKGYFAEEGLELEFDYSFETDGMALVGANEVPFALVGGDQAILARAQDVPVVYFLEWFQKYPIAIVSREEGRHRNAARSDRAQCRPSRFLRHQLRRLCRSVVRQ